MRPWNSEFESLLRSYCRLAPAEDIDPNVSLALLGVDSLTMLGFIIDIEETFQVAFQTSMLTEEVLATPANVWDAVQQLSEKGVEHEG